MSVLGERIKKLREKHGKTQKQLAVVLGISNVQLSRYETGDRNPDPDMINHIADYFDVPADYLLGRDGSVKENPHIDDPDVQFIMRAKEELSPKAYEKFMVLTRKAREIFEEEDE